MTTDGSAQPDLGAQLESVLTRFAEPVRAVVRAECVDERGEIYEGRVAYYGRVVVQPAITATAFDELPEHIERKCCQYKSCSNTDLYRADDDQYTPVVGAGLYRKVTGCGYKRCSNDEWHAGPYDSVEELVMWLNDPRWFPVPWEH